MQRQFKKPEDEARAIDKILRGTIPLRWDGKSAVLRLKEADYQWAQMEWIGFYFEYMAFRNVTSQLGGSVGPKYGHTTFDYQGNFVWDFKAHVSKSGPDWAILNDSEAIEQCIRERGGIGIVIACCDASYDQDGSFKKWHDDLKGSISRYESQRIKRKAPSRRRKVSVIISNYKFFYFSHIDELKKGVEEGWLKGFQKGMRNSNNRARRNKFLIRLADAAEAF